MRLEELRSLPAPGNHLCGVTWDGSHLWHSDGTTNMIYKLDPMTGEIGRELACDDVRTCLAFDGTNLWQIAGSPKRIRVIRPSDGSVLEEVALNANPDDICALYIEQERYWLGYKTTGIIEERVCRDHHLLRHWQTNGGVHGLVRTDNILWYTDYASREMVGWEMNRNIKVAKFDLPGHPTGLCRGANDTFWYCNSTYRCLTQVEVKRQ